MLRIEQGYSRNPDDTWNAHIILRFPDHTNAYYYSGEPGQPFRSADAAKQWVSEEIVRLQKQIEAHRRVNRLMRV